MVDSKTACIDEFDCKLKLGFMVKTFFMFVPCAVVSGFLYFKVVMQLRQGREDAKKAWLSRCLCVLWFSWVLSNLPSVIFEIWLQTLSVQTSIRYDQYWDSRYIFITLGNAQSASYLALHSFFTFQYLSCKIRAAAEVLQKIYL